MSTCTDRSRCPQPPRRSGDMLGWWRNAVIYQVYVRSFQDSDGDGVGDLGGVRARLPYLRSLGVDGIWLNPFYPSPQHDHGYDVADYLRRAPRVRHARVLRPAGPRRPPARPQGASSTSSRTTARSSTRGSPRPWPPARAARSGERFHFADGRGRVRRAAAEQLALDLRRVGLAAGHRAGRHARAVVPAHASPPSRPTSTGATRTSRRTSSRYCGSGSTVASTASGSTWRTACTSATGCPTTSTPIDDELTGDPVNPHAWNQPEVHDVWRSWRAIARGVHRSGPAASGC